MIEKSIFQQLNNVLEAQEFSKEDIADIKRAYEFAAKLHDGQYRVSEEPYIIHPTEVAMILADLNVDKNTIIAALMHDIIEDTETKPEEIKELFGDDVLNLVMGVTKLGQLQFKSKEERQAENFRRMIIAMSNDMRIILLKLADRLHNMRTLSYMAQVKQRKIAQETLDIFAPLANRLGIGKMKGELEDLSLRYLNPEKYFEIAQLVAQTKSDRDDTVSTLIEKISYHLEESKIKAKIQGRAKHYFSIYSKMKRLNLAFHDLYDITAVRVIVDSEKECYEALGVIHSQFKPIPGRFKDYIAMPKSNLYRSLHTSVLGPRSKPLEVQIRTQEMHDVAEYGVAAHWKYKEIGKAKQSQNTELQFNWMRKLAEIGREVKKADEFQENVKVDFFADQVFTFTPNGDVVDLPKGATPVDFAYRIHTDVGNKITGALVNGRIAQLDTKLRNGDIVEVFTAKNGFPKLDWLNFVVTKQAQSKIRSWVKKNKKSDHIHIGKSNLEQELTKAVFDEHLRSGELEKIALQMNFKTLDDMFASVGYGETTVSKVLNKIKKPKVQDESSFISAKFTKGGKDEIIGVEGLLYNFAKCCTPIPGEKIIGIVTRSNGVSIHRADCNSIKSIPQERYMQLEWRETPSNKTYTISLKLDVMDRVGMFKEVLTQITDCNTNISHASSRSNGKVATIELGIEVNCVDTLQRVLNSLEQLADVYSVKRVQSSHASKQNAVSYKPKKKKHAPQSQQKSN